MARLKIVNNFDSSFVLDPEARDTLFSLLKTESFLNQVAGQIQGQSVEFTELLFQPVPCTTILMITLSLTCHRTLCSKLKYLNPVAFALFIEK
jgi:hypothetical protein